jgi:manganese/zinc/iron transport system permease protein
MHYVEKVMDITLIFTDYTLRNVALGAMILGVVSGVLGAFAVLRRQALLGDAMSHAALPGVVIAFMLTGTKALLPLMLGAIIAGWIGARFISSVVRRTRLKEDTALGIILSVFFGFGLLLLTYVQRQGNAQQAGLDKFLFGKAAAIVTQDVIEMGVVGVIAVVLLLLFWKEFKLLAFDPEYTAALGFPVRFLDTLLTTLIVVAIVLGLQTVGVVLMSAMIVAPASAARQWTDKLSTMVLLSAFFGVLGGVGGALISATSRGLSTGPVIVLSMSSIVLFSILFAPNRGIVWRWWRQQQNRRHLGTATILADLYDLALAHGDPKHSHPAGTLQAARPHANVKSLLATLEQEGMVYRAANNEWGLTDSGIAEVKRLNGSENISEFPSAPAVKATASRG